MTAEDPFAHASPLRAGALVLRFVLELALLAGVAALAVELTRGAAPWVGWPLAVGAVLAVAALWGALLSPKAPIRLPAPAKLLIELALFAGVALGLAISGHWLPAAAGLGLWAADRAVLAATAR